MIRIGVTGGIGSGKTTFCKEWEKRGAFVVFADDVAKELMVSDEQLIQQIKDTFGDEAYLHDGSLNREYLAEEAFAKNRVEELNALVHPVLWKHIDELALIKEREGIEAFVYEAALLLKKGRPKNVDRVVLLLADEQQRIKRVVYRDGAKEEQVKDRISKQNSFEELTHLADYVIRNDGSLEDLKIKASELFDRVFEEV
ncbi:MAG: dephospho-CoA kinase [Balneolaceae bacterium]|nr:dephospho-CoA kinase [Balneolaceae bacterium]